MASPRGESSNYRDSNRQFEPLSETDVDQLFSTLEDWNTALRHFPEFQSVPVRGGKSAALVANGLSLSFTVRSVRRLARVPADAG